MATRNLTKEFLEKRARRKSSGAGVGGANPMHTTPSALLDDEGHPDSSSSAGGLPPVRASRQRVRSRARPGLTPLARRSSPRRLSQVWVDYVDNVERDISQIQKKMDALSKLHQKRLMTFDDSQAHEQDAEIGVMADNIQSIFRKSEKTLKKVAAAQAQETEGDASGGQLAVQKNIQRSMAMKLQALSGSFRDKQKDYLNELAKQKGGGASFDFLSDGSGPGGAMGGGDLGFNEQQLAVVESQENAVRERDEEIQKIARSIQELSDIFKELAVLVIDQGTILDRIDFNMEQVVEHVEEGIKQLEKAEEYQKSARPKWCIAILLFLITCLLVFLVLKHRKKDKHDDDDK